MVGFTGLFESVAAARIDETAGMVTLGSASVADGVCNSGVGVGGGDSPRTAVVGRKREAITTRWLRKEDMAGVER